MINSIFYVIKISALFLKFARAFRHLFWSVSKFCLFSRMWYNLFNIFFFVIQSSFIECVIRVPHYFIWQRFIHGRTEPFYLIMVMPNHILQLTMIVPNHFMYQWSYRTICIFDDCAKSFHSSMVVPNHYPQLWSYRTIPQVRQWSYRIISCINGRTEPFNIFNDCAKSFHSSARVVLNHFMYSRTEALNINRVKSLHSSICSHTVPVISHKRFI